MSRDLESKVRLNNGVEMPQLGMGVWKSNNKTAAQSVEWALNDGYRAIDTAKQYGNEAGVGEGLKKGLADNGLKREDVFLTTKVFNGDQGYDSTLEAFEGQLKRLQTPYVDLLLIHWPVNGKYKETWRALEKIYHEGKARAIGVSNFNIRRLRDLMKHSSVKPAVNQMEFHPLEQEADIKEYCDLNDIKLEAWSPLGGGEALGNPLVKKLAEKYGKSTAQIILRWDMQRGIISIPKSAHEKYIQANADIFDFELDDDDIRLINSLNVDKRSIWYGDFRWNGNPDAPVDTVDQWDD
ncbi:aldo/keto reductase [Fructilactobacillus fructivorans]|uniref:Aldo/keto reductase n=1 Tax=Fructilactobacillus fructivorans TaxID=1614 RepID=A0A0C1LZD7_9LACO|nr:aldo/keto reductase [Fructilactobacillus fructivorans]KID42215.1 oxidoreductase of aldo/keto reductase family, subgroup 1 [Fructilactobacillus fructivorans]MCT0151158.1 aldo/keto reductase [Fructilactobacillus fructivorans]MCT2867284.1 aldo/keto reductase [Fructilactobacillus fructivorans]MCT2869196.1 aldo/keto reductase [Fructilactobacillus fructivorans]MCT2873083.1 aldo/keto reductase [Fructilactobacillus fructivorans]